MEKTYTSTSGANFGSKGSCMSHVPKFNRVPKKQKGDLAIQLPDQV